MAVTRTDLQKIAAIRLAEARMLLKSGHHHGAFYLAGYVIECGLKACVAKTVGRHDFPDKKKAEQAWNHDLEKLAKLAGLQVSLQKEISGSKPFESNWAVVIRWSPEDRYNGSLTKADATSLYKAITSRQHGILKWLRKHW